MMVKILKVLLQLLIAMIMIVKMQMKAGEACYEDEQSEVINIKMLQYSRLNPCWSSHDEGWMLQVWWGICSLWGSPNSRWRLCSHSGPQVLPVLSSTRKPDKGQFFHLLDSWGQWLLHFFCNKVEIIGRWMHQFQFPLFKILKNSHENKCILWDQILEQLIFFHNWAIHTFSSKYLLM